MNSYKLAEAAEVDFKQLKRKMSECVALGVYNVQNHVNRTMVPNWTVRIASVFCCYSHRSIWMAGAISSRMRGAYSALIKIKNNFERYLLSATPSAR